MKKKFEVSIGTVPVEATDTDEDLRRKAHAFLPKALKKMGEQVGEHAWDLLKKGFQQGPLKMTSSPGEKSKFVRGQADQFARKASLAERKDIEDSIFEQLQRQREDLRE